MKNGTYNLGVFGHRGLGSIESHSYVQFCCHQLLAGSKQKYSNVVAISAISDGADSIFAQSAISLGIRLQSIIPFGQFASDFQDDLSFERYRSLRSKSEYETKVNFLQRSDVAYKKSMEWVVFKSNTVIAIWDSREEGAIGGTWEAVSLSKKIGKSMVHIDNTKNNIHFYFNDGNKYKLIKNISVKQNYVLKYHQMLSIQNQKSHQQSFT